MVNLTRMRPLIFHFAVLNITLRFKNTYLGVLWAALEPLFYFLVLYLVFTSIRDTNDEFPIYLITGIMFYQLFSRGTSGGLNSLIGNSGIIKSLNLNREFFPVVSTVAIALLAIVTISVFFGLMPIFEFVPTWTIVFLPIPLLLLMVLILGLSYFLSVFAVYVRDIQHIWTIILLALLFASPIFWYVHEAGGFLQEIHKFNPLGQLIEISHKLVVSGEIPNINDWLYTTIFVFVIFFVGYATFHKLESKIAEEV